MYSAMQFAIVTANRNAGRQKRPDQKRFRPKIARFQIRRATAVKGSITFKFSGDVDNCCVRTLRDGDLDSSDLEAIVAVLDEEIRLKRLISWGEITPTLADPTGARQLNVHWSN